MRKAKNIGSARRRRILPGRDLFSMARPELHQEVAFLRHTMPRSLGFGVLAWNLLLRIVGLRARSPLMLAALLSPAGI